jgi:imidazolonepropionase-like amidohydrolase
MTRKTGIVWMRRFMSKHFLVILFAFGFCASQCFGERFVLRAGAVHTISGETIANGEVLVDGKEILEVGEKVNREGARILELPKQHLYPGLIAVNTTLGLVEIEAVRATRDFSEVGQFTPDVQSWIAVNPDSELIPVARAGGVTHAEPIPAGGIVSGHSGLIALAGWTTEEMVFKKLAALRFNWPDMDLNTRPKEEWRDKSKWKSLEEQARDRQAKLKEIDDFFNEAKAYAKAHGTKENGDAGVVPAWEAMLPCVRGEIPVIVHAEDVRQIKAAVQWADTNGFYIAIAGGRDAAQVAELLAKKKVPVIYNAVFDMPANDAASYDFQFKAPATLHKAGVKVVFSEGGRFDATSVRNLPYTAAQAVAFGLPRDEAVKGITLYAAQVLGVADRLGSIEKGKDASLIVVDGDILDLRANVKRMWIAGQEVSLETRHTRLYNKYRSRPAAH